jgi:hypothetical protein
MNATTQLRPVLDDVTSTAWSERLAAGNEKLFLLLFAEIVLQFSCRCATASITEPAAAASNQRLMSG